MTLISNLLIVLSNIVRFFFDLLPNIEKWKRKRNQNTFPLNYILSFCIIFIFILLFFNRQFHSNHLNQSQNTDIFINQIRNIIIFNENLLFNITYSLTNDQLPKWLYQYQIIHLFNFYWLQNGGYHWHLQRMFDMKYSVTNLTKNFQQFIQRNSNQIYTYDYIDNHPEYGIILDTAPDPIRPLFPSFPQASIPLKQICQSHPRLNNLFPCQIRTKKRSSLLIQPLITYVLYDVTIDLFQYSEDIKINHYDELIILFDINDQQQIDVNIFIQQILPRFIRLLALVPQSAMILLPNLNNKTYLNQYFDIFIERGLINDKNRLIHYNSSKIYHANAMYFTSSPRSDLILLHRILTANQSLIKPRLIIIIRHNFDNDNYLNIIQTINLFEFPNNLHIHEYSEQLFDLKQISSLFSQAYLIIGMPNDFLSHIVWCQTNTHIIEIIQKTMTTNVYEISLQLRLNYWLIMTTERNRIDMIDLRNLIMKIFMDIET